MDTTATAPAIAATAPAITAAAPSPGAPIAATAHSLDDARHPAVRRVADVLRSRSASPNVFVIDDPENIEQAVASGVI